MFDININAIIGQGQDNVFIINVISIGGWAAIKKVMEK